MIRFNVQVRGVKEEAAALRRVNDGLRGGPLLDAMHEVTLLVTRSAKMNLVGYQSPRVGGVDTGYLRANITPEVEAHGDTIQGVVGSDVIYAPFVELDTRPHWPPLAALELWARRHGTTAYVVARAIARRGTYGKHYMERAFRENAERIVRRIVEAVRRIVEG